MQYRLFRQVSARPTARRGYALVWGICCIVVLLGFGGLAVDFGRITLAQSELQAATDAAARYAAGTMRSKSGGTSAAGASASAVFAESRIDGSTVSFNPNTDLTLGIWDAATETFTPATLDAGANAVKVQTRLVMGDASRPLALMSVLRGLVTIRAECIAQVVSRTGSSYVSAKSNPWLSGMPSGSVSQNLRPDASHVWDYAGNAPNVNSSPGMINLSAADIQPGKTIMFDNVTGTVSNDGSTAQVDADGNTGWVVNLGTANGLGANNWPASVNGISNIKAPMSAMIAVFLSDSAPNTSAAPTALDFSTAASRNYSTLSPQLKQVFFVGDGRRSNGEPQQIVVPAGATRVFIGNMDAWQWNDNVGGFTATINSSSSIVTVK